MVVELRVDAPQEFLLRRDGLDDLIVDRKVESRLELLVCAEVPHLGHLVDEADVRLEVAPALQVEQQMARQYPVVGLVPAPAHAGRLNLHLLPVKCLRFLKVVLLHLRCDASKCRKVVF